VRSDGQLAGDLNFKLVRLPKNTCITDTGHIRVAVNKLKSEGFSDVVIAADHGFVLNAHAEAGDVCAKPPGTWRVVHERALLGENEGDSGNFVMSAEKAGVRGDFAKFGGPRSMAPYRKGLPYFHGGASLQEAVVPVITIRLKHATQPQMAAAKVTLAYKNGAKRVQAHNKLARDVAGGKRRGPAEPKKPCRTPPPQVSTRRHSSLVVDHCCGPPRFFFEKLRVRSL
jgi:hypothetical protein